MTTSAPVISIAILTYRRPDDLAELLPQLAEQAPVVESDLGVSVELLVVDNDPEEGARALVEAFDGHPTRYVAEGTPGIAAARNRALDEASTSDVLIFIDDDERPVENWMRDLLGLYLDSHPAAVVGPVVSRFAETPDPWIAAGRFFDRRRLPTGTDLEVAATNNLLLDLAVVRRLGLRFNAAFGLSGGSDTLFTRELVASGARMVWCDEAIVYDIVPMDRLTRRWVLQRAYRSGNSWSRTTLQLAGGRSERAKARLELLARAAPRVLGGAALTALGAVTRRDRYHAGGMKTLNRGRGMLAGVWGHVYSEYRRD